jgi:hypothetical protein
VITSAQRPASSPVVTSASTSTETAHRPQDRSPSQTPESPEVPVSGDGPANLDEELDWGSPLPSPNIKTEPQSTAPDETDDEIQELPKPYKPPPPVVDLSDDSDDPEPEPKRFKETPIGRSATPSSRSRARGIRGTCERPRITRSQKSTT